MFFVCQLRRAAEQKADEDILKHIHNRDCVAVEVRYHRDCYMMYIKDVYSLSGWGLSKLYIMKTCGTWFVINLIQCNHCKHQRAFHNRKISRLTQGWKLTMIDSRFKIFNPASNLCQPDIDFNPGWSQPCSGPGLRLFKPGWELQPGLKTVMWNESRCIVGCFPTLTYVEHR